MKVIFLVDADDTILDFHGASAKALVYAFEKSGLKWREEFREVFQTVNDGLWEALERKELTRSELIHRRFSIYLKYLGFEKVNADEFNERFLTHLATHPIYMDGAENFLEKLNQMGRVYIVTNGTADIQKSRFDIAKLWDKAEEVFVSDLIGYDKPAREYTDFVTAHIPDFDREKAVWIGDSLSADIRAANEAGIDCIWYNPKQKELSRNVRPDYIATSFEEILAILEEKTVK